MREMGRMFTIFLAFWVSCWAKLCYNTHNAAFWGTDLCKPGTAKTKKRTDAIVKRNKWTAALLALVLMLALPLTATAQTFSYGDYTMEIPDGMYQFSLSTPLDDPSWALAGIADPQSHLESYSDMHGVAEFISEDGETSILVQQQESSQTKQIYNLGELSEEEKAQFLDGVMQSKTDEITIEKEYVDVNGQLFYRLLVDGSYEGEEYHELVYATIVNGYTLGLNLPGGDESITPEQEELMRSIVDSITFTEILPKPENVFDTGTLMTTIAMLVLLVLVILVPVVYFPMRNKRDKRLKAKLAAQLTEYHKTHGDNEVIQGEMLFANSTDCTKEAIHDFSMYQCYVKSLGSIVIGVFLCAAALIVSFALNGEWWVKVLAVGVAVYYGYKIFNAPHVMEKTQRRVYDRGISSTAHYAFYDEAFRVSGIQSASVFPYFQITDIRRHKQHLYLYYGPENAYMVDKNGFSKGSYEEFVKFLAEKTGKKF